MKAKPNKKAAVLGGLAATLSGLGIITSHASGKGTIIFVLGAGIATGAAIVALIAGRNTCDGKSSGDL